MALVTYPHPDWESFINVASADAFIASYPDDKGWGKLTPAQKESIVMDTATMIRLCPNIKLPATMELDLGLAQGHLIRQYLSVDMFAYDPNSKALTEEHAGSVGHSYDARLRASSNLEFPPMVYALLKKYGCMKSGGFTQVNMGRA